MNQKGFALILILLGIVVMVVVAGGAYYFGRQTIPKPESQNPSVTSTPQVTSQPITSLTPSLSPADETANWKTYKNAKYNLSFKYPTNWDYPTTNDLDYIVFKLESFKVPAQVESQIPGVSVSLMREDYDSAVQRLIEEYGSTNKENIISGKLNWVHIWGTITEGQAQGLSGGSYVLNYNGKALELGYEVIKNRSYNQEAKQILSTFKFTN